MASPEIALNAGALVFFAAGAAPAWLNGLPARVRPGSWSLAEAWEGSPGNLGDPVFAHVTKQPGRGDGRVIKLSWPARHLQPGGSASASTNEEIGVER